MVGLYALIQFLESYLLTPLIQARAVSMPPAVVILSQLVLGAVFGLLGLALATPLAAAATVPLRYLFGIGERQAKAGGQQSEKEPTMRLLFFAGSTREGSFNKKLAALAHHIAEANGIEAVLVDLKDYPMPLYNGDLEAKEGPPERARAFKALLGEYQGVFIASPEYNSSVTPLLKNTLDWVTRVRAKGETGLEVFKSRVFAISGASPGYYGAMRSLLHLRQILEVGIGATVIPQQIAVPRAMDAFEADGSLKDKAQQNLCKNVVEALAVAARRVRVMTHPRDRLIVALDVPSVDEARALIETLGDSVGVYKIGLELLFSGGFALAQELAQPRRPGVRRRQAARHRSDGRAGHRGHRPKRRRVSHRARARPQDARRGGARTGRQRTQAARRHGAHQSRARRRHRAGMRPSADELVLHRAKLAKEARLRRRDRLWP